MIKKLSATLPLAIFIVLIIGVGYFIWDRPDPTPTPTVTENPHSPTPPSLTPSASPTLVEEVAVATSSPSVMPTTPTVPATPTLTSTPTETPIPTNISTPTPTPINTPTPTQAPLPPPPSITGIVEAQNLNVRWGPGMEYSYVGAVYEGEEVVILGRESNGYWLKIEMPNHRSGWVVTKYITTPVEIATLSILPAPPPPPATAIALSGTPRPFDFRRGIDIEGRSILDKLGPYEEHWYTFLEKDPETVVVFMFKPNVNFYDDHFVGYNVEFFLHDENQIPVWPPGDADSLPDIGAGQTPAKDRDGKLASGELIWRGGPLVPEVRYYLRFVNRTPETLEYCLTPGDVHEWRCSQN